MRLLLLDAWLYVSTLRARFRARKLGVAFIKCPSCRRWFSIMDVWATSGGHTVWMDSPGGGRSICGRVSCRQRTVARNRYVYGRDLRDPYPAGIRLPTIEGEMPQV